MKGRLLFVILAAVSALALPSSAPIFSAGAQPVRPEASATVAPASPASRFSGRVMSAPGVPVAGATVHLVTATAIDRAPISASDVYYPPYRAEVRDEPLEDTIRNNTQLPSAKTDATGRFVIPRVPDGKFFIHVTPARDDAEHLPGGDQSRVALSAQQLRGKSLTITVSSRPPDDATYVGSTTCLACHQKYETWKQTGHKLSWTPMGAPGTLQDHSKFPEVFKSLAAFKEVDDYTKGTRLELGDRDPAAGSSKFAVRQAGDARLPIKTAYADLYLWKRKADGKYFLTIINRLNPSDPNSPTHLEGKMTYGGMVGRQRFVVAIPSSLADRQGWYVVLEFHPAGSDSRLARERRVWYDFQFDQFWSAGKDQKYGTDDDVIAAPPINRNTVQAMCAGCHVTGWERYKDPATGQLLVRAVNDANGELNIDDDPQPDEVNIGCESCHGPGSKHVANGGRARFIVSPRYLSAERSAVVCGRCHDRRSSQPMVEYGYTQAINKDGKLMRPGGSRHEMITEFSDLKQRGPIPGRQVWDDDQHSKYPHQQYSDFLKSKLYRNDRLLVTCSDCHNAHGGTPYRRLLISDPDDSGSALCQRCHAVDVLNHMETKLNARMKGTKTRCLECHMPGTMTGGPGVGAVSYGRFVKTPPYKDAAEEKQNAYWEGHIRSHVFRVPFKTNVAVRGKDPGLAMPIPYTNSCGTCHDVSELRFK